MRILVKLIKEVLDTEYKHIFAEKKLKPEFGIQSWNLTFFRIHNIRQHPAKQNAVRNIF